MRAQEQQAQQARELSGAGAGFREPGSRQEPDNGRRSIETPPPVEEPPSTLAPSRRDDSDDLANFEDDDEGVDEENDLA
jgi:hypothetical protein